MPACSSIHVGGQSLQEVLGTVVNGAVNFPEPSVSLLFIIIFDSSLYTIFPVGSEGLLWDTEETSGSLGSVVAYAFTFWWTYVYRECVRGDFA